MTHDASVSSMNGATQASAEQRLRTLRAEATRLVDDVPGPLKHVALRAGDCVVELTWADPLPVPVGSSTHAAPAPLSIAGGETEMFTVVAPLVGVFYAAPSPGDLVGVNQVVGIIEAMKLMNEISTAVAGIVTEVLVADGQPVEFGQELVRVQPDPETDA